MPLDANTYFVSSIMFSIFFLPNTRQSKKKVLNPQILKKNIVYTLGEALINCAWNFILRP